MTAPSSFPVRRLGSAGLEVPALGLGCMGMSDLYGDDASRDDDASVRLIHRALEIGISFLDTADMYGPHTNEELVGRALRGRRDRAIIATKFGIVRDPADALRRDVCGTPEYVRQSCEASLQRLGTDRIDLYYLHRRDPAVPIEETVGAMADLVSEGKVRFLGLSEVGADTLRRAHAVHAISALQSEWSLWTRDWERSVFPTARELGIGIVPYSPLGRGFLTGRITSPADLPENDYRHRTPRFQAEHFANNRRLVDAVVAMAEAKGCTPAQLALAWVLSRGSDVVPIPGTTSVRRLEENAAAVHVVLDDADLARLEAIVPVGAVSGERYPAGMKALVEPELG
jgi:aryl-alcohol dehydrogenase-like predicted oxidoreductase